MHYSIVGGGGYIGYHIAVDLIIQGNKVVIYDLSQPELEWVQDAEEVAEFRQQKQNLHFVHGDILSLENLTTALTGSECVIHCVSYGMSGREQMWVNWDKTELINIEGTKNVIQAACSVGARGLVYTSTFNVVFGGQEIVDGDETLPYFPIHRHVDNYSRTKSIAEQLVLGADGKKTLLTPMTGDHLRTCSLRLAGVIGPKERRHIPRVIWSWPFFTLRFGYEQNLVQFVGIENVVQAHVKASIGLMNKPEVVGGHAYFISDGVAINPYEYFRPLMDTLGHNTSKRNNLPMFLIWFCAYFTLFFHWLIHPIWDFTPLMAPAEVSKMVATHFFSCAKAKRDFGYEPQNPNDLTQVCKYYSRRP